MLPTGQPPAPVLPRLPPHLPECVRDTVLSCSCPDTPQGCQLCLCFHGLQPPVLTLPGPQATCPGSNSSASASMGTSLDSVRQSSARFLSFMSFTAETGLSLLSSQVRTLGRHLVLHLPAAFQNKEQLLLIENIPQATTHHDQVT